MLLLIPKRKKSFLFPFFYWTIIVETQSNSRTYLDGVVNNIDSNKIDYIMSSYGLMEEEILEIISKHSVYKDKLIFYNLKHANNFIESLNATQIMRKLMGCDDNEVG